MAEGMRYQQFCRAKQFLRGHPQAADEDVAAFAGLKLAFAEERDVVVAARTELINMGELPRTSTGG